MGNIVHCQLNTFKVISETKAPATEHGFDTHEVYTMLNSLFVPLVQVMIEGCTRRVNFQNKNYQI